MAGTFGMSSSAEQLFTQIEKLHLISPKDIEAVQSRWFRPGRKEVQDAHRFCDWLRVNDYVTDFVLSALMRGKADKLILNQYRLTDALRTGERTCDFLATDPLDRSLRLQVVSPAVARDADRAERLQQAVQKAMQVQHPAVARVLDIGQADDIGYVVSEHVEGESLEEVLQQRGKLSYDLAARIFAIVFDALHALHQQGVHAGELSADCLVFAAADKTGGGARTVRIVNAGLPRHYFDASALGLNDGDEGSRRKPAYDDHDLAEDSAPEEDILRLGELLYRCITGQEPYKSARLGRAAAAVRQTAPEVPHMLADLVDRLIDPVPANRPRSAAAVAKSLRVFLRTEEEEKQARVEEKLIVPVPSAPPPSSAPPLETEAERLTVDAAPADAVGEPEIARLFRTVIKYEGSDLHLAVGIPPMMRLRNVVRHMDAPALGQADMERLVDPILNERTRGILEQTGGADFAYVVGNNEGRFRVNLFKQQGNYGLVARRVNTKIPTFEKLGLPPVLEKLCLFDQGMVIVAGVTGSGKSTTLAAMLDYINEREQVHILTIEDPIEYLFTSKKAVVNQREVGIDVANWEIALKHAVRQDPDVILVGEMRDRSTFEAGINAAETGHLVFCTIHASSAPSTIGRILDLFPADMHQAMRQSLAFNLKAIICQKLLPGLKPGVQRVPTNEIMMVNPTIRELIVKGEDKKLPDAIRIGVIEGMIDFNESLRQLVARGDVDQAKALEASPNPDALKMALKGIKVAQPGIL
jgi:twitching motility protein PilT